MLDLLGGKGLRKRGVSRERERGSRRKWETNGKKNAERFKR